MENQRIFLVLTLFIGVSLTIDEIGNFRDKTAPNKWSFFERSWNRKSKDPTKRYQLPNKVTTVESDNDDNSDYHRLCRESHSIRVRENRKLGNFVCEPVGLGSSSFKEVKCSMYGVHESDVYMFDGSPHQLCAVKESVSYFCATMTKERTVTYECKFGTRKFPRDIKETYHSGCECVYASDF